MGMPSIEIFTNESNDGIVEREGKFFFVDTKVVAELGPYDTRELAKTAQTEYEQSISASGSTQETTASN